MASLGGQPVLILKEGTERTQGKNAQKNNILAAIAVCEAVRTSLGPKGMDKMLVDQFGDVVITNDGATILKEIDVQHPSAKMLVEVAKTVDEEVGDGTTTSVILTGELLKRAEKLLDSKIHPTMITEGYRMAAEKALEILDSISTTINPKDREALMKIANTSINSKVIVANKEMFSKIVVDAALAVIEESEGKYKVDLDKIQVIKKEGATIEDTQFIAGIILDKEIVNPSMKKRIENAKILLLQEAIEITKTEFDAKLQIRSPDQITAFLEQEENMLKDMVEKIKKSGANFVVCQKGIDDLAQHFLAKAGIAAVRRVKKSDLEKLSKATGGTIYTNLDDITPEGLGHAGLVEERKVLEESWVFVEQCKNPKAVVIFVRGGSELIVDEAERSIHDALCVVRDAIQEPKVVGGAGAAEVELSVQLKNYGKTIMGRESFAIQTFADALEIIPKTLAENAGFDQIELLMKLRAEHASGKKYAGLDLEEGKVIENTYNVGIVEPTMVKKQTIKSASEAAQMILRIDDIIASQKSAGPGGMPGGGPGGMPGGGPGGMPPM